MRSIQGFVKESVSKNLIWTLVSFFTLQFIFCLLVFMFFFDLSKKYVIENISLILEKTENASYQVLLSSQISSMLSSLNDISPLKIAVILTKGDRIVFDSYSETEKFLTIKTKVSKTTSTDKYNILIVSDFTYLIILISIICVIFFFIVWVSVRFNNERLNDKLSLVLSDLSEMVDKVQTISSKLEDPNFFFTKNSQFSELSQLEDSLQFLVSKVGEQKLKINELSYADALNKISKQVAHDIRSPLSALQIFIDFQKSLPDEQRILIQSAIKRIREIADNLLTKRAGIHSINSNHTVELVSSIESLIEEKRAEYHSKNLAFIFKNKNIHRGFHFRFPRGEFERILSNLLNNSVEANAKKIIVAASAKNQKIAVTVIDDGNGISQENIKKIATVSSSFSSKNTLNFDHGLGLSHAQKTLKENEGSLKIKSQIGRGTLIRISIPVTI